LQHLQLLKSLFLKRFLRRLTIHRAALAGGHR
jgi:hypothetical protein